MPFCGEVRTMSDLSSTQIVTCELSGFSFQIKGRISETGMREREAKARELYDAFSVARQTKIDAHPAEKEFNRLRTLFDETGQKACELDGEANLLEARITEAVHKDGGAGTDADQDKLEILRKQAARHRSRLSILATKVRTVFQAAETARREINELLRAKAFSTSLEREGEAMSQSPFDVLAVAVERSLRERLAMDGMAYSRNDGREIELGFLRDYDDTPAPIVHNTERSVLEHEPVNYR